MKLGSRVQISIGVPDLSEAQQFYESLGYKKIDQQEEPWPWAQYSDGQNLVLLNQDGNEYIGLLYLAPNATEVVAHLEEKGTQIFHRQEREGVLQQVIFGAHNLLVSVVNHDPAGLHQPDGNPLTRCGKFGEFAVPVSDFDAAAGYWQQMGFEKLFASNDPYPWGIFNDGNLVMGIHQVQDPVSGESQSEFYFEDPTITFFAGNMAERIAGLRADGFSFDDYDGGEGNAILIAPGNKRLFLFEGEI